MEREDAALATRRFCSILEQETVASGKLSRAGQAQPPALLRFRGKRVAMLSSVREGVEGRNK